MSGRNLPVKIAQEINYHVVIGKGALARLPVYLQQLGIGPQVMIITDENVNSLYAQDVEEQLQQVGFAVDILQLPAGETYKVYGTLGRIYPILQVAGIDRSSAILALGGGVVGDIAGMAAATWQRGVSLVQVPTTLLAQVDSCMGGKVGVNHLGCKNLIGTFYHPKLILVDPALLTSLSAADYRAGMAEVVKTALLAGQDFWSWLQRKMPAILLRDEDTLSHMIEKCLAYKAGIVSQDPQDHAGRHVLNLGHTLGHAIEEVAGAAYSHGQAVSVGLHFALRLSERMGLASQVVAEAVAVLQQLQLPLTAPGLEVGKLERCFAHDKKAQHGYTPWVLLPAVGKPTIASELPADWRNILAEITES